MPPTEFARNLPLQTSFIFFHLCYGSCFVCTPAGYALPRAKGETAEGAPPPPLNSYS